MSELIMRIDDLRLRTHFALVTLWLKVKSPQRSGEKHIAREKQIAELRRYAQQGIFPRNHTHKTMRPCFIDHDDRCCAVAHLLIQSGYEDTAQMITVQANNAYVPEMRFPEIDIWAEQHGLTRQELAVIQPAYPPTPQEMAPLYQTIAWLGTEGVQYLAILIVALGYGVVAAMLSLYDWRRRWGRFFPILSIIAGIILFVVSWSLLNVLISLIFFNMAPHILDDAVSRMIEAAQVATASYGTVSLIGLGSALLFVLTGMIMLVKYWRRSRRERQQINMEVVTA